MCLLKQASGSNSGVGTLIGAAVGAVIGLTALAGGSLTLQDLKEIDHCLIHVFICVVDHTPS